MQLATHTKLLSQRLAEVLISSNITPKKTKMVTIILANPAIRTDFAAMLAISMNALSPVSPRCVWVTWCERRNLNPHGR